MQEWSGARLWGIKGQSTQSKATEANNSRLLIAKQPNTWSFSFKKALNVPNLKQIIIIISLCLIGWHQTCFPYFGGYADKVEISSITSDLRHATANSSLPLWFCTRSKFVATKKSAHYVAWSCNAQGNAVLPCQVSALVATTGRQLNMQHNAAEEDRPAMPPDAKKEQRQKIRGGKRSCVARSSKQRGDVSSDISNKIWKGII